MKNKISIPAAAGAILAIFFLALCFALNPWLGVLCIIAYTFLFVRPADLGQCGIATLIVPILTGKVFEAFKSKPVGLDYFSTDFGKDGSGFAQPEKFGQEVISQLASVPAVNRATPGGLLSAPQSSTALVSDVRVAVDRMAVAKIRLPSQDIEQLKAMPAFMQALSETGMALGRFVAQDAINEGISRKNFTNFMLAPNPDLDSLENGRQQLNAQFALGPRYGLGSSPFVGRIGEDPRVLYSYGFGQKQGADTMRTFENIQGFSAVKEMVSFPTGNSAICTFTADSTIANGTFTVTALAQGIDPTTGNNQALDPVYNLYNGMRVQITATGGGAAFPNGLAAATNYIVTNYNANAGGNGAVGGTGVGATFQLAAENNIAQANGIGFTAGIGAQAQIANDGGGTLTLIQNENCESLLFERRGIHIAFRPMIDPTDAARKLGIPTPILTQRETDEETGADFLVFLWQDCLGTNPTLDIFASFVVMYGIRAGRGIQANFQTGVIDPTTFAAGTGMDRAALRVLTA